MVKNQESNVALYRKYRPQDWSEVIGQEHVTKVLEGAINLGNISHAYLFAGSRGTGKTSVARIFARAIGSTDNDIYEIDAASNTGVDDMRTLTESVSTLPFESKFKVYIIDEVHMLSKSAFNAFLKTLEEPPQHVVFILATTETDKLPETVVSRCQTFSFKKPSQKILKELATQTAKKEGFSLDTVGAELISILGDGSFRDTHGIIQKVISSSKDKKISAEEIEIVTGAPRGSLVNDFIVALAEGKKESALQTITKTSEQNIEMKVFLKLVLQKLRAILLIKSGAGLNVQLKAEFGDDQFEFLKGIANNKDSRITSNTLLELLTAFDAVGHAYIPQLPVELAVIKLLA